MSNENQKKCEQAYGQGQRDAAKAGVVDGIFHVLTDVFDTVLPTTKEHQSYMAGWGDQNRGKGKK